MKVAVLSIIILSAAVASAETIIIEYPDHYYVESTGTPASKPAPAAESSPPVKAPPVADYANSAPSAAAIPVTNFDGAHTPPPVGPADRRVGMNNEIQRLQGERGDLLIPRDRESGDDVFRREQRAAKILQKINRMSSELLKMPGP